MNIPEEVIDAVRQRGWTDKQIGGMSGQRLFREYCEWHGLVEWGDTLWEIVSELKARP